MIVDELPAARGIRLGRERGVELGLHSGDPARGAPGPRTFRRLASGQTERAERVAVDLRARRVLGQLEVTAQEVLVGRLVHREGDDVDRLEARGHALLAGAVRVAQRRSFRAELISTVRAVQRALQSTPRNRVLRFGSSVNASTGTLHPALRTLPL